MPSLLLSFYLCCETEKLEVFSILHFGCFVKSVCVGCEDDFYFFYSTVLLFQLNKEEGVFLG